MMINALSRRRAGAASTYYLITGVSALCYALSFTLSIIYMVTVVGLDPLQLVLVGTVLEATCFLLEIPTGVVADTRSRRLSVLIGFGLIGVGLSLQAVASFAVILIAQVVWGTGTTFTSGATEAWITDEVGEARVAAVFTRGHQVGLTGTIVGILGAGALSLLDVRVPLLVSGAGFLLLTAILWRIMPEDHFQPTPREQRQTFRVLADTTRAGLALARRRPVVRAVLLAVAQEVEH